MGSVKSITATILASLLFIWLGYFQVRADFSLLLISFTLLFVCFYFLYRESEKHSLSQYINLALGFRLLLLFSIPALSDDYYRFLWDGMLMTEGINPYTVLPSEFVKSDAYFNAGIPFSYFSAMNSPDYYTVYPPVEQFVFFVGGLAAKHSTFLGVVVMRLFIVFAEAGTILLLPRLLKKLKISPKASLLYSLNPLVIVELTGNLHFEALMIFFLLLGIWFIYEQKWLSAAVFWGLAISTKLMPLIFLPVFLKKEKPIRWLKFYVLTAFIALLTFAPFFNLELFRNLLGSLELYFQKFEFNAGIYYIIRWLGFEFQGYNIIQTAGMVLSLITLTGILALYFFRRNYSLQRILKSFLFAITLYFLLATTVHPWYISTLVFLSVFTGFKYPVAWSFVAILSYSAYSNPGLVSENMILILIEYLVLFSVLFMELIRSKRFRA